MIGIVHVTPLSHRASSLLGPSPPIITILFLPKPFTLQSATAAAAAAKSLSLAEKGAAEEEDIRRHLLRPLLEHTLNLFFVVILAGYLFLMFASLEYLDIWFAAAAITFMSPYFLMMLHAVPFLKGVYIEQYAVPN